MTQGTKRGADTAPENSRGLFEWRWLLWLGRRWRQGRQDTAGGTEERWSARIAGWSRPSSASEKEHFPLWEWRIYSDQSRGHCGKTQHRSAGVPTSSGLISTLRVFVLFTCEVPQHDLCCEKPFMYKTDSTWKKGGYRTIAPGGTKWYYEPGQLVSNAKFSRYLRTKTQRGLW